MAQYPSRYLCSWRRG